LSQNPVTFVAAASAEYFTAWVWLHASEHGGELLLHAEVLFWSSAVKGMVGAKAQAALSLSASVAGVFTSLAASLGTDASCAASRGLWPSLA
jgi:hypothetical protein